MSYLILAISGCSGGNLGPQKIYPLLDQSLGDCRVLPINTLPDDISTNVEQIKNLALNSSETNIYLLGHSMGGAVAAGAAYEIEKISPGKIKGIVLLSSQTDGLHRIYDLAIPILFYHGKEDELFPAWEIQSIFSRMKGRKQLILVKDLGHDLDRRKVPSSKNYSTLLAQNISEKFRDFFLSSMTDSLTTQELALPTHKTGCILQ